MIYIVMCGGEYSHLSRPKQLFSVNGETIINRTLRLLREEEVDIYISSNNTEFFNLGVPVLVHNNTFGRGGHWLEAFYPTDEPACYICGDVIFSKEAIHKIVSTDTDSIQFFASSPPFDPRYHKKWAEPFAMKVRDQIRFRECVNKCIEYAEQGKFNREPIMWELWQVIKGTPLNYIDYKNYVEINDYTCDVDSEEEYLDLIERGVIK